MEAVPRGDPTTGVRPAIVAELSYPEELWIRRSTNGQIVWGEWFSERGVCWLLAQTSQYEVAFRVDWVPEFKWEKSTLHELLGEARELKCGVSRNKRVLPIAGVLVDFERKVYVR